MFEINFLHFRCDFNPITKLLSDWTLIKSIIDSNYKTVRHWDVCSDFELFDWNLINIKLCLKSVSEVYLKGIPIKWLIVCLNINSNKGLKGNETKNKFRLNSLQFVY